MLDRWGARLLQNPRFARAPLAAYRHGFGWLFGHRMLMLQHLGRSTGLPRYVCLEVVDRPAPDVLIVASGFGERSQWYRNLRANPNCKVSIGAKRNLPATARTLSPEESAATLARYQQVHPMAWRQLRGVIEQAGGTSVDALPMVALSLTPAGTPSDGAPSS